MSESKVVNNQGRIDGVIPNKNDVLCGRGSGVNSSSGNVYFRKLVRGRKNEYKQAKRHLKIPITKEIIDEIKSLDPPGRFLVRDEDNQWREYSDEQAMVKTAQALREGATKAERTRMFLNGVKDGGISYNTNTAPSSAIASTLRLQHGLHQAATMMQNRTHFNMVDLNNLNNLKNTYTSHSSLSGMDNALERNLAENKYIQAFMQSQQTESPLLSYENERQPLHHTSLITENIIPKLHIPSIHHIQPPLVTMDVACGRFDDAEEEIEMPIKILMESVQMGRRLKFSN